MKSSLRIGLLLTLAFLLPAMFFSVYQLSSLNEDEEMIQKIHNRQLEAILFSVNQYSDDIISSWVAKIEGAFEKEQDPDSIPEGIDELLFLNSSLMGVFRVDTIRKEASIERYSNDLLPNDPVWKAMETALNESDSLIKKLLDYKKSQFQKIVRMELADNSDNLKCLIFISQPNVWKYNVMGLIINADSFIEDMIGPRLQSISSEQFLLTVRQKKKDSTVYSTVLADSLEYQPALTKEFWILPEYELGISPSGTTIEQLARERTDINLLVLIALNAILIIGVVLVFRNLKKEVDLAQNKSDFVSNVSHEIRTPLALISMFAETLEMNRVTTEEKKQEYYRILSKETQRLSGIVNKILSFSQTEAKKKSLHIEPLEVDKEMAAILDTYDFHLKNKGFEYSYSGSGKLVIMADREAFTEALVNLIDNAMKYSGEKKRIEISTGTDGPAGFIAIKDHGVGISKKDQKHIFDKFYRVPAGNLARSQGTGLGLSLVKQLMDSHKGVVKVQSEPGKGSTFTLYFPLQYRS